MCSKACTNSLITSLHKYRQSPPPPPRLKKKGKLQLCTWLADSHHQFVKILPFSHLHLHNIQSPPAPHLSPIHWTRTRESGTLRSTPIIRRWARQSRNTRSRSTAARTPVTLTRPWSRHWRRVCVTKVISSLGWTPWSRVSHIPVLWLTLREVGVRGGSGRCGAVTRVVRLVATIAIRGTCWATALTRGRRVASIV